MISNEEDNHAIVQVTLASHNLEVLFGHPGEEGSDGTHLKTPDDAYMLPGGTFTVADAYNCRILFIKAHAIVRRYGTSERVVTTRRAIWEPSTATRRCRAAACW